MRRTLTKEQQDLHDALEREVQEYLAKGKEIEELPGPPERNPDHRVGHGNGWGIGV